MSRAPALHDDFLYLSHNNTIKRCKPAQIIDVFPPDFGLYYERGRFPKVFATIDLKGVVQKYVVFFHRKTLYFVPQNFGPNNMNTLDTKRIFTYQPSQSTYPQASFIAVSPTVSTEWVIGRCQNVTDDFSIEAALKAPLRGLPATSEDVVSSGDTQRTLLSAVMTNTVDITPDIPISAEKLDILHHARLRQRTYYRDFQEKLRKAENCPQGVTSDKVFLEATPAPAVRARSPVPQDGSHFTSHSEKASSPSVAPIAALVKKVRRDDSPVIAATRPFICVIPVGLPDESQEFIKPKTPTQSEIDQLTQYLRDLGVQCTDKVISAIQQNKFVATLAGTIASYDVADFSFLTKLTEKDLLVFLSDRNIAGLNSIILLMRQKNITIDEPCLLTIAKSIRLDILFLSLGVLLAEKDMEHSTFRRAKIALCIMEHNQRYNLEDYDEVSCTHAWQLAANNSFAVASVGHGDANVSLAASRDGVHADIRVFSDLFKSSRCASPAPPVHSFTEIPWVNSTDGGASCDGESQNTRPK